jgi:hypothetical protein
MVLRFVGKAALLMIAIVAAAGAGIVRALGSRAASLVTAARARHHCPPIRSSRDETARGTEWEGRNRRRASPPR